MTSAPAIGFCGWAAEANQFEVASALRSTSGRRLHRPREIAHAPRLRQCERDDLPRILPSRDRHGDVLLAVHHVGHWRAARAGRQLHLPDDLARLLVEGAEHPAAAPRGYANPGVTAFAHEDQRLRHDRRDAAGRADGAGIPALERRVPPETIAVG